MTGFDLVVRGGKAMIGQALVAADIGVSGGRIVAIGEDLAAGAEEVDARGRLVLPGGIDSHCHLDQPTGDDSVMADDFRSGTRSAAAGGTATVIPFACQLRGQSLRAAVADYHGRAEGKALIDYAFHLIVTDPTAAVLGQELPALIADGYTSFKIYMTYDALKLDDRQMLDVLSVARDHGAESADRAIGDDAHTHQWHHDNRCRSRRRPGPPRRPRRGPQRRSPWVEPRPDPP